jgi:imidazolonepropionase-like amidohydrolase
MKKILIMAGLLCSLKLAAQVPAPAPAQQRPILLTGATVHVGNGKVYENAAVGFENGKITFIGEAGQLPSNQAAFEVINVAGKHVYPGLIAPNSALGLSEVEAVRSTVDEVEVGALNPNVRSLIAYNTDSDIIPTVRSNGVLMVQVTPVGDLVPGSSSIVQLDAWNWEDAVVKKDVGIHMNWPLMFKRSGWWAEPGAVERNKERDQQIQLLDKLFSEAAVYKPGNTANLKLASMRGLFDGSQKLFIHADYGKEIIESINFAKRHGVKDIVLVGGMDAWMVTDFLKDNNISVVLSRIHDLPRRPEDDVDLPYKMPFILKQAGVDFCLSYNSNMGMRNLPFLAGTAAAYGLSKEEALMTVTSNAARIMGIANQTGSIELGKDATLVVSDGDLLDMRTNNVTQAYIQGRKLNLTDKQKVLNEKFQDKYGIGQQAQK